MKTQRLVACGLLTVTLTCAPLLTSCTRYYGGAVSAEGYRNKALEFEVRALPDGNLMGPDWRLDNLYGKRLKPKQTGEYKTTYYFDGDGDGRYEHKEEKHAYELRFEHLKHAGAVWLRLVPISATDSQREPRVLARDYLTAIAGVGVETASLYAGADRVEKRFAAEIVDEATGTFAGAPAHAMTIDVANVDQVQVVKSDRVRRVRVLFARPAVMYKTLGKRAKEYPVLFVAGYSNLPEDYDRGLPDFDGLLDRVSISGKSGANLEKLGGDGEEPTTESSDPERPTDETPAEPESSDSDDPEPEGEEAPHKSDDKAAPEDGPPSGSEDEGSTAEAPDE